MMTAPGPLNARFGNGCDQWLMRRPRGRCEEGTANTMTQSAAIASPMNSNTNASTAISRNNSLDLEGTR
jgi:hypothetical protein